MAVPKLLLVSALLLAILVLSEITTQASADSHHRQKHRHHRHHNKHRNHPPRAPPPRGAPPPRAPPPALPPVPPGAGAPCEITFGPWPPTVPAGSVSFNDGAHANFSQLTVIFTREPGSVDGLLVEYSDRGRFFLAQHGAGSGELNSTFVFDQTQSNIVFRQVGGTYTAAGLDSITFVDSNDNFYFWGAGEPGVTGPTQTAFQSPPGVGYVIGLFGAANATALTQIGVCVTGA